MTGEVCRCAKTVSIEESRPLLRAPPYNSCAQYIKLCSDTTCLCAAGFQLRDERHLAPLEIACLKGHVDVVAFLLRLKFGKAMMLMDFGDFIGNFLTETFE